MWDYAFTTPAGSTEEVASHYIIHGDTLVYPRRCDPVQQDTYTFHLTSDTLFLTSIADGSSMKIKYSFSQGKLRTTEIHGHDASRESPEKTEFVNVKRQ